MKKAEILDEHNQFILFIASENTWSHQRRKRRNNQDEKKRKLDFDDENESKKRRSEDTLVEKYLIKCSAEIKLLNKIIYLNISYKGGETKDYVHQILQFIKNKFEKINI